MKSKASLLSFIFCILFISLLTSGGCDIEFSGDGGNDNGNGGGGMTQSLLRGTITQITPDRSLAGIIARIIRDDQIMFDSEPTSENGFFRIDGDFNGSSLRLEFRDVNQSDPNISLAARNITVFPDAEVALGNIEIANGNVIVEGKIIVTFVGDIAQNNCSGAEGTLFIDVATDEPEVIVQVTSQTIIEDENNQNFTCDELLSGEIEITGELLPGDTVAADSILLL